MDSPQTAAPASPGAFPAQKRGNMNAEALAVQEEFEVQPQVASKLPEPRGYKLLIGLPEAEKVTRGGIIKAEETVRNEEVSSVVGVVLALGPDAYKDKKRFPSGAYCQEGDFILMRAYSGTRFMVNFGDGSEPKEFRLINDDSVEAVVQDPRGIRKL